MNPKIYFIDIETSPLISYTWGTWEQNVIEVIEDMHILCFSAKKLDEPILVKGLCDYPIYKTDKKTDEALVRDIWKVLDDADIVIWQNGDKFDMKKINTRFSFYKIGPPSPYKTVDTLKVAKKYFSFDGNSLDKLSRFHNIGKKLSTGGFELWKGCMAGDRKAWRRMKKYNAQDLELLEALYKHFLPWITNHPNYGPYVGEEVCSKCGSKNLQSRGFARSTTRVYQRYQCQDCGGWSKSVRSNTGESAQLTNA